MKDLHYASTILPMDRSSLQHHFLCDCSEAHTGTNIHAAYETLMEQYEVSVNYIITDNASNMIKAFKFGVDEHGNEDDELYDDVDDDAEAVEAGLADIPATRLSCYAHTLQLSIHDGLKKSAVSLFWQMNYHCAASQSIAVTESLNEYHLVHQLSYFVRL